MEITEKQKGPFYAQYDETRGCFVVIKKLSRDYYEQLATCPNEGAARMIAAALRIAHAEYDRAPHPEWEPDR